MRARGSFVIALHAPWISKRKLAARSDLIRAHRELIVSLRRCEATSRGPLSRLAPATTLFAAFYEALTKPGPPISQAEALRQAMLVTRQADGGKWAHPAFWAGFGLIGAAKGL